MKKIIISILAVLLSIAMCFSFTGCGSSEKTEDVQKEENVSAETSKDETDTDGDDTNVEDSDDDGTNVEDSDDDDASAKEDDSDVEDNKKISCKYCEFSYSGTKKNGAFIMMIDGKAHSHSWNQSETFTETFTESVSGSVSQGQTSGSGHSGNGSQQIKSIFIPAHGLIGVDAETKHSFAECSVCGIPSKYCVSTLTMEEFDLQLEKSDDLIRIHNLVGVSDKNTNQPCVLCGVPIRYCKSCVPTDEYNQWIEDGYDLGSVYAQCGSDDYQGENIDKSVYLKTHDIVGVVDPNSSEPCPKCDKQIRYCVACVSFEEFDRLNSSGETVLIPLHEISGWFDLEDDAMYCDKCNIRAKYCMACLPIDEFEEWQCDGIHDMNYDFESVYALCGEEVPVESIVWEGDSSGTVSIGSSGTSYGESTSESISKSESSFGSNASGSSFSGSISQGVSDNQSHSVSNTVSSSSGSSGSVSSDSVSIGDKCGYQVTENGFYVICPITGEKHIVIFD